MRGDTVMYLGIRGGRVGYELAPYEMASCKALAEELCTSKERSKKTTPYSGRTIEEIDYDGVLGEFVAHEHYGEDFAMEIDEYGGDVGYDMVHRGAKIQIKTTPYLINPLLLVKKNDPQIANVYLLVRASGRDSYAQLVGYATRSMIFREENMGRLRQDLPVNYMMKEHQLKRCQPPA